MGKRAAGTRKEEEQKTDKEKVALLEGDASDDEGGGIRVNAAFARVFEARKRKEELGALERRRAAYGDDDDDEDESESETEDEDGEELTPALDADIRKTLRLIRKKDPAIYNPAVAFFKQEEGEDDSDEDSDGGKKKQKQKKDAPLYYKDLVRQQAIAGDVASDDESDEEEKDVLTFKEEQAKLRQEFLASVGKDEGNAEEEDEEEEEGEGGLFTVRKKSAGEQAAEDAEMAQFTSKYGTKQKAGELDPDAFLEHYLSSEGWKDKSAAVPHYEDIVKDDEEDAEALDKAESFEHAYNFRFEEEGGGVIQTYARKVEDSMRRVDDARKRKREERKARKALERQKKEEELRRLKNLKQAEIQAKLDKVARLMGAKSTEEPSEKERLAALANDLDADFDPEAYDKKMQAIFDDEYYQEGEDADAMEKPTWDDEEDKALFAGLPADPDEDEEDDEEKEDEEEEEEEEVADEEQEEEEKEEEGGDKQEDEAALENMTVEEMQRAKQKYLDELYSLDYEDLIGDLKCRFKYRQVRDNDFGLTVDEIMAADDKELKQLVSLKRLAPYVEDEYHVDRKKLKRLRKSLEQERREKEEAQQAKAKRRREAAAEQEDKEAGAENKPKKKRKRGKKKETEGEKEEEGEAPAEKVDAPAEGKKKRRGKKSKGKDKDKSAFASTGLSTSRLESYKLVKSKS